MTLKRHIVFWAALICLVSTQKAQAIINGNPDTTHDCVGAVYYEGGALTTGVLVNASWVLTVAHALDTGTASHFIIGDDFSSLDSTSYPVDQIIVHPNYSVQEELPVNNIALLHLATPVTGVDILPLMSSPTLMIGTNALAIGYGITSNIGDNTLRHSITTVIDSTQSDTFSIEFTSGGPCSGDSGGPCIVSSGGTDTIAGIISYGDCSSYTVCSKVSSAYPFITNTIESEGGDANHIPMPPGLLSPSSGATGVNPSSVTFSWNPSTDGDGDTIHYQFYLSEDPAFAGCTPEGVTAKSAGSVHTAGLCFSGIFLCFLLTGLRNRLRQIPVICLALLLCVFAACSDSSDITPPDNTDVLSHVKTGLNPSATYYWKVTADDGHGGIRASDVRSFTTADGL